MKDKSSYNIHSSGGLITQQFLNRLNEDNPNEKGAKPDSFNFPSEDGSLSPTELENEIGLSWNSLKERFDKYEDQLQEMDKSKARRLWIKPLLNELGFEPKYLRANIKIEGKDLSFDLSHRGWNEEPAPIIHTVEPKQGLDEKEDLTRGSKTPHDKLQAYLNISEDKWAIVTNGIHLRLVREFYHTYTKGYIEFDLENIFIEREFDDFRTLYRLVHASRFIEREKEESIIESFYKKSVAAGVKVGDDLRKNVKKAIEILGNGFLDSELKQELLNDPELTKDYYNEVLHIIYRLLFLLYAEQRGMLPMRDSLYAKSYSITKLRDKAEKTEFYDEKTDLWEGLKATFRLIREGSEDLDIFGYNGGLFDTTKLDILENKTCENSNLLKAIKNLTIYEKEGVAQRISYLDIGVEEIGSIYESLLDYEPRILPENIEIDGEEYPAEKFFLDPRGAKRKSTGSYFTPPKLVNQLIDSALKPVVKERIENKQTKKEKENTILDLKICDPATGSGAFLIAANNYLANKLAKIRTESEYPPTEEKNKAKREVLQHCIYGVDKNPMAVKLAKVSLWINAAVEDKPLNFLDHHIKCGNSIIGSRKDLIKEGIPQDAYALGDLEGEARERAKEVRKKLRKENRDQSASLLDSFYESERQELIGEYKELDEIKEMNPRNIEKKKEIYQEIRKSNGWKHQMRIADIWTAAFFCPLESDHPPEPTTSTVRSLIAGNKVDGSIIEKAQEISDKHRFFHWELEFPEVFSGEDPGFDCVLGNPPWDVLQAEEEKFFLNKNDEIAAASGSERKNKIKKLKETDSTLYEEWIEYKRDIDNANKFFRNSNRFPLTAQGKLNYYPLFAEHNRDIISPTGRVGIVIASGIATDYYNQDFFQDLMQKKQLASLYDFENKEGIFPAVHRSYKFSLSTLTGRDSPKQNTDFAFFLHNLDDIKDEKKHFTLSAEEIKLLNPNTKTCPIFRSKKDAKLTKKIYRKNSVLVNERNDSEDENPWRIKFKQGLFNMTSDSHLFKTKEELENKGFKLKGNIFQKNEDLYLPLYEAKIIWLYDHRYAEYSPEAAGYGTKQATLKNHKDPNWEPKPQHWVKEKKVEENLSTNNKNKTWFICFRDITNAGNERTAIFSLIPKAAIGNNLPFIPTINDPLLASKFIAIASSFILDFVARQKISGTHLNFHFVKQFSIPAPEKIETYSLNNEDLSETISEKVLRLFYTSYSLKGFAEDLDYQEEPFEWDPEGRRNLRAELNAIVAHLYGVSKDDLDYILETFPIVKKDDIEEFGEFRTKNLVLDYYDEYEDKLDLE